MSTTIPSLSHGPSDLMTTLQQQLWSILAFCFNNPGSISNQIEQELISFRLLEAKYGNNKEALANELGVQLSAIYDRVLPDDGISVTITVEDVDEVRYNLVVSISSGNAIVLAAPIAIITNTESLVDWSKVIFQGG